MRNYKHIRGGHDSTLTHHTGTEVIQNEAYESASGSNTPIQMTGAGNTPAVKILGASTPSDAPEVILLKRLQGDMRHRSSGDLVDDKQSH